MEATQLQVHLADQNSQLNFFTKFFWHRFRSESVIRYLRKYRGTTSVVDIGAGAGVFGIHLRESLPSAQYFFIEPIPSLQSSLSTRFGSSAAVDSNSSFHQSSFVMLDVLEHIDDDKKYLSDLKVKMPSGSLLIVTCPASMLLWSKWDEQMGHCRRYSRRGLTDLFKVLGFDVLESRYMFHAFVMPAYLRTKKEAIGPEFPRLSIFLNSAVYWYCKIESVFSRWLPFGTSILVVVRKP